MTAKWVFLQTFVLQKFHEIIILVPELSLVGFLNVIKIHANRNSVPFNQLHSFFSEITGLSPSSSVNCQEAGGCFLLSSSFLL